MPEPLRSPKQSRVTAKNKSHPYARPTNGHRPRDAGLQRSSSILGTIRSFVTAPLAWLSLSDSQEHSESPQKRRVSGSERGGTPPKAKRARRESPDGVGYLDPPNSLFTATKPLLSHANGVPPTRTMSIDPPNSIPIPLSRGHSILSRTSMSVEPQGSSGIRRSTTRDLSMPPPSPFTRSFSRSSLTPQPAGATFGPSPKRRQRESTAPPLLGSSTPTPSFTRPPPSIGGLFPRAPERGRSEGPISALLARNRQSVSPVRESPTRSMLIRDEVHTSGSLSKNTAEQTLSTLESFRTPLHVSRFPSSAPLTAEHRPRKIHVPMSSKLGFDHTPEGRKDKAKRAPAIVGPYSSGMSGMRKLLARRREEAAELEMGSEPEPSPASDLPEEAEMEHEAFDKGKMKPVDATEDLRVSRTLRPQVNGTAAKADVPRARSPPRSKADGLSSTLRAPSSRVSRTHAPAPKLKARNKFSLNDDDDEPEWSMSIEEVKSYQAQATKTPPPISFGITRQMSEAGMQTDIDNASVSRSTSPPLPAQSQTFDSLLSRIGTPAPASAKPATEFPAAQKQSKPDAPADLSIYSSAPTTLPFSLGASIPASPKGAEASPFGSKPTTPAPSPKPALGDGAVPSFFTNSKTQFTPPKVPSGSLFGGPLVVENKEVTEPKDVSGETANADKRDQSQPQKEVKPSPFGGFSKPSMFGDSSKPAFGDGSLSENTATTSATPSPFGGFGGSAPASKPAETAKSVFPFGAPAANGSDEPKPGISIFGAASKPNAPSSVPTSDAATKPAFSFGASPSVSAPSTEKSEAKPPTPTPAPAFSFGASPSVAAPPAEKPEAKSATTPAPALPKSAFSFGTSTPAPTPPAEPPKVPLSVGSPASTQPATLAPDASHSPFSFGAAPSTPPPADKKPASVFSFGNTTAPTTSGFSFGSSSSSTDAPKPLFGGFGGGGVNPATTGGPKTPEPAPAEGGDGMEMNGDRMEESPTRSVDKKDAIAPQLPQSSPFASFGGGGGGGSGGFSFGQNKTTSSTGAFSFEQPKQSSTTGTGFGGSAFAFGNDASKNTGQSQSQSPFGPPVNNPFGGGSASNLTSSPSFSFGQPSSSTTANPFGQPQQQLGNTATTSPSSPSVFPQPTLPQTQSPSFSFSAPSGNPFSSPPTGTATPSSPTIQPFQFSASGSMPQAGAAAGNTMFTLGGAATPPRKVKGLPTRRGSKK